MNDIPNHIMNHMADDQIREFTDMAKLIEFNKYQINTNLVCKPVNKLKTIIRDYYNKMPDKSLIEICSRIYADGYRSTAKHGIIFPKGISDIARKHYPELRRRPYKAHNDTNTFTRETPINTAYAQIKTQEHRVELLRLAVLILRSLPNSYIRATDLFNCIKTIYPDNPAVLYWVKASVKSRAIYPSLPEDLVKQGYATKLVVSKNEVYYKSTKNR